MSRNLRAHVVGGVAVTAFAAVTVVATSSPRTVAPAFGDLVNERLGLAASTVQTIETTHDADRFGGAPVTLGDDPVTLRWGPHSVRAEGYQLRAQQADGSWIDVDPGPERTVRGVVEEIPGARTAGAVHENGLYLTIRIPGGEQWWIEPVPADVAGAAPGAHVVYNVLDVLPTGASCGFDAQQGPDAIFGDEGRDRAGHGEGVAGGAAAGDQPFICVTELGCDADVEYHNDWGGVMGAQDRITLITNTMNLQYESETAITHLLTTILVRTAEPDPYSSFNSTDLLCQFINEWTLNQPGIQRDVAQLFTGREVSGSTIGQAAQFGGICLNDGCTNFPCNCGQFGTSGGYCFSQSDFNNNFSCATDLSSHELGHLWNAAHCNCVGFTMHTPIQCANQFTQGTINVITSFRDANAPCIECGGQLTFEFPGGLPGDLLDRKSGDTFLMVVEGDTGTPQPGTGMVHVSENGGPFVAQGLDEIEANVYEVRLGPFECGTLVEYFFSAETTGGIEITEPLEAPVGAFTGVSATDLIVAFGDDFENDLGWTVQNSGLTDGAWERGVPVGGGDRGDPPTDADGSGQCYLTDNVDGNSDVDGGSTTLVSPVLDASGAEEALLRYDRWFHNSFGAEPFTEPFFVEVSDDGGATWTNLETVGPDGPEVSGGWVRKQFKLSEIGLEANDQVRVRFRTQDPDPGAVVEAGVDGVEIISIECSPGVPCLGDTDGSGTVDVTDLVNVILDWGSDGSVNGGDVDGSGIVDVTDLVTLILAWGVCP